MQTTQVKNTNNWNNPDCLTTGFRAHRLPVEQDIEEWVATSDLDFAVFTCALMEAKESGWKREKVSASTLSKPSEQATQPAVEDSFEVQKQAFMRISPEALAQYHGKFVASRNGEIVDNDIDLVALSHRVREQYGNAPVYITRIGKAVKMPTPFVR